MIALSSITHDQAATRIEKFADDGRLVQGTWHSGGGGEGREIGCLLGAIHPDINGSGDCPAHLMPEWLASLTVTLFDGVRTTEIGRYGKAYAAALRSSASFLPANWTRIRNTFLIHVVKSALEAARPKVDPVPEYWPAVEQACGTVLALLAQENPPEAEMKAAWRAATAAAATAAWRAAATASEAAARAARAAATAAATAAWRAAAEAEAAAAAREARAIAYEGQFDALLAAIAVEAGA